MLDVVVDSLPYLIGRTWGAGDGGAYTALLNTQAPDARATDPPAEEKGQAPPPHSAAWIEGQHGKDHVVGTCSAEPGGRYCDPEQATVVATLSRVRLTSDGVATVEVALGRRDFGTIVEVRLGRAGNGWTLSALDVIVIS